MKNQRCNQYTGYEAPGFRFRFRNRKLSHVSYFLPLEMKELPEIKRLMAGETPQSVFHTDCIHTARERFAQLRKRYDFSYWAITEYYIRDRNDADNIIPLKLNVTQRYIIDILRKRYYNRQPGRYVISKTCFPNGTTTCVQAYILWMQTYQRRNNSYMCSSSDTTLHPYKSNLCRWLKRDVVPAEKWLYLPKVDGRSFFNTYRNPNFCRGINLGYVHLADMSKWKDAEGKLSSQTWRAAVSGVLLDYFTLVVMEGNIPPSKRFDVRSFRGHHLEAEERMRFLGRMTNNPYFLNYVWLMNGSRWDSTHLHINLDDAYFAERRMDVPLVR